MFSPRPSAGTPAATARTRRRQRPLSSDSLVQQQPKAKRQRLPITDSTFVAPPHPPPPQASSNGTAPPPPQQQQHQNQQQQTHPDAVQEHQPEMSEIKPVGTARLDMRPDGAESQAAPPPAQRHELTVRSKKTKLADRTNKGDGSIVLMSNSAFVVTKLPALPDRIRADIAGAQHGQVDSSSGHALSLTHTHAIVWLYASTSASPETFVFTLPYPSKHSADPLPVGCLVSPSASSTEPGLVVVMPSSGRITYWESISAAATLDFMKQERLGVESSISAMASAEKVTQITNAESAGFILSFSSGRLAYMSLRDGHGRPAITTAFLGSGSSGPAGAGGILGSLLRNALNPSAAPARGDLAAVHAARPTAVGERTVVALTVRGRIQAWRIHRGGHHAPVADVDLRADIVAALRQVDRTMAEYGDDSFEAIDFALVPKGLEPRYQDMSRLSDAMASQDDSILHLCLLVSLTRSRSSRYAIVEVIAAGTVAQIGLVRPILSYDTPVRRSGAASASAATATALAVRPRLYLPRPALVAFVVFERAVVVASIAVPPQSPDAQLREDSHIVPVTYEDVIDFRNDDVSQVVGSGFEEPFGPVSTRDESVAPQGPRHRTKNPSVLLMVRGAGILRVTTTDVDKFAGEHAPRVTAKSKLEQAIFFGAKPDNPLVFDRRPQTEFSDREYADAALRLSDELLTSSCPLMSSLPISIEENLVSRSSALEKLMTHLRSIRVHLDRTTRWMLLSNGEKLAIATLLWKQHETFVGSRPVNDKRTLINHVVEFIHEDQKANPVPTRGQVDYVRHWFIHDVGRLDVFIGWCYEALKYLSRDAHADAAKLVTFIHEAVQVTICAIMTGLEFRKRNLAVYGLENEDIDVHGLLRTGYEDLPEPWSARPIVLTRVRKLVERAHQLFAQSSDAKRDEAGAASRKLLEAIRKEMPILTELYLTCLLEASRHSASSSDEKLRRLAAEHDNNYEAERQAKSIELTKLLMWEPAALVAERHQAWKALAMILIDHIHHLARSLIEQAPSSISASSSLKPVRQAPTTALAARGSTEAQLASENKKVERMFDKHGQPFAFALYEVLLEREGVVGVLTFDDKHGYKTRFLRARSSLARVSWINDIDRERDIDHAAETLLKLGLEEDHQVWSKKIELSLSKLALLAEAEGPAKKTGLFSLEPANAAARHGSQLDHIDRELAVIKVQEQLYATVYQTISVAVDDSAELELAMGVHGLRVSKMQHKPLRDVFEAGLAKLIRNESLEPITLIDLLTLLTQRPDQDDDVLPDPFHLAMVVAINTLKGQELEMTSRLIWRRCFIHDDWAQINDTNFRGDQEVTEVLSQTALFTVLMSRYQSDAPAETVKYFSPSDVLDTYTDSLDRRFDDSDKALRDKLMAMMRVEDAILRRCIEKNRLEEWAQSVALNASRVWAEERADASRPPTRNGGAIGQSKQQQQQQVNGKHSIDNGSDDMDVEMDMDNVDRARSSNGLVTPPLGRDEE